MVDIFLSLLMGFIVGVVYGLVQVRSPAPPVIALVGLLGMVLGEHAIALAGGCFAPSAQTSSPQSSEPR